MRIEVESRRTLHNAAAHDIMAQLCTWKKSYVKASGSVLSIRTWNGEVDHTDNKNVTSHVPFL